MPKLRSLVSLSDENNFLEVRVQNDEYYLNTIRLADTIETGEIVRISPAPKDNGKPLNQITKTLGKIFAKEIGKYDTISLVENALDVTNAEKIILPGKTPEQPALTAFKNEAGSISVQTNGGPIVLLSVPTNENSTNADKRREKAFNSLFDSFKELSTKPPVVK